MTKKILLLAVLVIAGLLLLVVSVKNNNKTGVQPPSETAEESPHTADSSQAILQKKTSQKPSTEQQADENQCSDNLQSFSREVNDIHQILISALQQELKQGKTTRELLSYSAQYKTFYSSYEDLLWQAQINNEMVKYKITSSAAILMQWQGVSVIEGLSEAVLPILVESLTNIEGQLSGLNMELSLSKHIDKAQVYQLLDNDETFNTYFQSPLSIAGSPVISPSILFVLTAKNLNIEEFAQAVSRQSFTVNDVAVAISNDLPPEYLQLLLQHTTAPGDMPVFAFDRHDAYANLADVAVAKHNVAALDMLEKYGVRPTNEPGILTGLDIAIMHLPRDAESYQVADKFPQKYLNTLQYLKAKGYKAHGISDPHSDDGDLIFNAPNRRYFASAQVALPQLKTFLHNIELLNSRHYERIAPPENVVMAEALNLVQNRKEELENRSANCQQQKAQKLAEESFLNQQNIRQLIDEVKQRGGDIPQQLHQIDPALVNIWQEYELALTASTADVGSAFIELLQNDEYQQAIDFVISTPLSQAETDFLFTHLPEFTEELLPLWQARLSPLPPSSLMMFTYLSLEKWQQLYSATFDFSVQDRFGNDMFTAAVRHSDDAVKFLLANGYTTETEKLGLDVLDLLLDDSYQHKRLHPRIKDILPMVTTLEPNHFSRIVRLQKFRPQVYQQLISLDQRLIPPPGAKINKIRFLH
ncbi:hypothetical protein [Rheinheimera nanhaiensis]|uniref:Uncharacterized protein n=1 Tax=Rheinheimera nanhaiensis E407-8 TaxID=562729 RepID=I1DXK2_9GAMM|nr:hypothetical protein [Rheinheimera nanhaiensis]GAB58780.1 hypothetical protein RNAN_1768 [Rheinheimera nanhaiensis E407-8]